MQLIEIYEKLWWSKQLIIRNHHQSPNMSLKPPDCKKVACSPQSPFCLGSPGAQNQTSVSPGLMLTGHKPFLARRAAKKKKKVGKAERAQVDGVRHVVKYNSRHHGNWLTEHISPPPAPPQNQSLSLRLTFFYLLFFGGWQIARVFHSSVTVVLNEAQNGPDFLNNLLWRHFRCTTPVHEGKPALVSSQF